MGIQLGNVVTAMVTPFDDEEEIDFTATRQLVDYLIDNGTDSLVVAGTTGESPTLTKEEKIALFQCVVNHVNGRVPVIAGTGSNNTKESIELTKEAEKIGVDGIMIVAPYYNRPCQRGIFEHFNQIAQATNLPIMLYNIPGRTGIHMSVETIIELSKIDNIMWLKDAAGNLDDMTTIIRDTKESFKVYSGDDSMLLPTLAIGSSGIVSVSSHIVGTEMQKLVRLFKEGKVVEAAQLHQQLLPTFQKVFSAPSPTPVKYMLKLYGICSSKVRLPMVELTEEQKAEIKQYMNIHEIA